MTRKLLLASSFFILYASTCFAQGGFEIGVNLGYNRMDTGQPGAQYSNNNAVNPNFFQYYDYGNLQGGLHIGYYFPVFKQLSLGVETGYQYLGGSKEYDDTHSGNRENFNTKHMQSINALLSLRYELSNRLAIFGKLGAAYEWFELTHYVQGLFGPATTALAGFRSHETRYFFNPELQVGALINLSRHTSASVAFNAIMGQPGKDARPYTSNPSVMGVLAGFNWQQNDHDIAMGAGSHPAGFEMGGDIGYNRVNAGQPGAQNSTDFLNGSDYRYFDYGNLQGGGHVGYFQQLYSRLLIGMVTGYRYIGGAKLTVVARNGNSESFNTSAGQLVDALVGLRFYVLHHLAMIGKIGGAYVWYNLTHSVTGTGPATFSASLETREYRSSINPEWQVGFLVDLNKHLTAALAIDQIIGQPGKSAQLFVTNPTVMGVLASLNWDMRNAGNFSYSANHHGGFEIGADLGYNKFNTGQPGNQYTSAGNFGTRQSYYDYSNMQIGGHLGYVFPVTSRLLFSILGGYQSLGTTKQRAANNVAYEQFNITSTHAMNALVGLRFYALNNIAILARVGGVYEWIKLLHSATGSSTGPVTGASNGFVSTEIRRYFNPEWQLGFLVDLTHNLNATLLFNQILGQPGKYVTPYISNPTIMGVIAGLNWEFDNQSISAVTRHHDSGFELALATGYNRINTGQPGNQASFDGNFRTTYRYTNYGNAQGRIDLGYYYPITKRWLVGIEDGYSYLGGAKDIAYGPNGSDQYKTQSTQSVDILVGNRFYLTNAIAIVAKLGGAAEWFNLTHTVNGVGPVGSSQNGFHSSEVRIYFNPAWQVGIRADLTSRLAATVVFNQILGQPGSDISPFVTSPTVMGILAGINIKL